MKRLALLTILFVFYAGSAQELKKNLETGKVEYIEIVEEPRDIPTLQKRLSELGYKNIAAQTASVKGRGLVNEEVPGFVVEITYDAILETKDSRYRISIANVTVKDKMGVHNLEDMGGFQKKWIKILNSKMPEIITKIKSKSSAKDW